MPATTTGAINRISFLQARTAAHADGATRACGFCIDINYENRRVMHAQTQDGTYRPELVVLFSLVAYHAAGLQVMSLIADASVLALCQVFAVREVCASLAPILPALSFIFAGFLVPRTSLPAWWKWARYCSYFSYPHEALSINGAYGRECAHA
eukprot:tig00000963_g5817.t1